MANVDISMPIEHLDELLGALPGVLPQIGAPKPKVIGPATDEAAPLAQKMGAEQGVLPPVMPTAQPQVALDKTSPQSQIQDILGQIQQTSQPRTPWQDLSGGQKAKRVLGDIGEAAGTLFAPRVMPFIPGTEQHRQMLLGREFGELGKLQGQATAETQQKETEAKIPLEQAQAAYYGAEVPEVAARGQLAAGQAKMYEQALQSMESPEVRGAFNTLSDPSASPQQRRQAMSTISQSPIGALPMLRGEMTGASDIYREGEVGSRVGGKNIIPDASSPTGYSTAIYDRYGNPMGSMPIMPSATGQLLLGPQGGQLMGMESELAGRRAAATQAQGLIPIISPQTNEVIGYAPKGSVAGATGFGPQGVAQAMAGGITPAPTTTVVGQAQMADTLQNMIKDNILPAINEADQAGEMGPASGRVQDFLLKRVGDPDSPAAKLQATLDAVPMMLGRMYGYRSAEYAEHLNNFMNTRMTPQALQAYLGGVTEHAQTVAKQGGMGRKPQEPKAEGTQKFTVDGMTYNIPKNMVEEFKKDHPNAR